MAALMFNAISSLRDILIHLFGSRSLRKARYGLPLPLECHKTIPNNMIGDLPILIIGDIHGCFDELEELVSKAKDLANSEKLFIICVGDMLNKGPKSLEVVRFLREMSFKGQLAAVRGNHEESVLREHRSMTTDNNYLLSKKYSYLSEFSEADFKYIQGLPYSLSIPQINAIIVHAGLVPGVPLHYQSCIDLCHMRSIILDRKLWGTSVTSCNKLDHGVGWATHWEGPEHVYFGHDARRGLQELPFATGLDTGCVYGGTLTGVVIKNNNCREFVSVTARSDYKVKDR